MATETERLRAGAEQLGVPLDEATLVRLIRLLDLLEKWNRAYNLTAVRDRETMLTRHLLDSLSLVPLVSAGSVADLGAGGGFPGLVLALHSPQRQVTLIDSNSKKTRFMTQCRLELGLDNIEVVHQRVEHHRPEVLYPQITSRAFTSLAGMVELAGHMLAPDGEFVAMKGPEASREAAELPAEWRVVDDQVVAVPDNDAERRLLRVRRA